MIDDILVYGTNQRGHGKILDEAIYSRESWDDIRQKYMHFLQESNGFTHCRSTTRLILAPVLAAHYAAFRC